MLGYLKSKSTEVLKAILPLVVVIIIIQFTLVKMPIALFLRFLAGAVMVITGMILFLLGIETGILPMGEAIGAELPKRRSLWLIVGIVFLIGFAATIAEPDVIVLTGQIARVSQGSISDNILIYVIGIGIAFFVAMAMLRIVFGFRMAYLLAASYLIVIILSLFTPAEFVPVAFDAGGVTTGPMTVPIILALGIGFSSVLAGRSAISDGFGLIGLASVGPIIAVMLMGIILH
ncbi:MAG: DUF1538 domain-containing protein [Chloroflexi bacterium]|nr:DUF1538 domain-containing protein [Chloroflexota bacterium]